MNYDSAVQNNEFTYSTDSSNHKYGGGSPTTPYGYMSSPSPGLSKKKTTKVYHDFYKTKMCPLFLSGTCMKGKYCTFAHNEQELREKPNLVKTKLCDNYLKGMCNLGDECIFAHGDQELRSTPDLFKTAICILWTQGKCPSGERCRFAHGKDDLRPAPQNQKNKKRIQNQNQNGGFNGVYENGVFNNGANNFEQGFYNQMDSMGRNMFPMYPMANTQQNQQMYPYSQDMFNGMQTNFNPIFPSAAYNFNNPMGFNARNMNSPFMNPGPAPLAQARQFA